MKQIIAFLTIGILLNVGCSGDKSPTGPSGQTIETYTEKWDNGNKKVEYTYYYEEGTKKFHGYYREYAESGTLAIEGEYKEGERWNGQFYLYVEWHSDETDDLGWNGVWRISDGDGRTLAKITYSKGIWEGPITLYDENGRVTGEENHVGGVLNGAVVGYHENGKTAFTLNYKDGKADGTVTEYDTEGNVVRESTYENGVCVNNCDSGVSTENQDLLVGTWEHEDEDGSLTFRSDGTLVNSPEGLELAGTWSLAGDKLTITLSEAAFREAVLGLLGLEFGGTEEVSDAQLEEFFDAFMAEEFPDGLVTILTINSITDTELITTDEDGERDVFTRQT